ncbi:hypothetical protein ACFW34_35120 [Streptomyces sp. NPDC058848]|uniref:hypothetical protein n=1 Tax=Streptomyces sp. NPDC058848 TaxID=3346650 RepID=UPI0036A51F27
MSEPDLQPDVGDVLQEEAPDTTTVPVCVVETKSPIRTQALPRKGGSTRTVTVGTTPIPLLRADHRRAWCRVRALDLDAAVAYAFTEASAQDLSTMAELPGLESDDLDMTADLWVRAVTGSARVSVTTSTWAEGE